MGGNCKYCGREEAMPIGGRKCNSDKCSPIPYYIQVIRPRLNKMRGWVPREFNQKRIPSLLARLHLNENSWAGVDKIISEPWPLGHFPGIWNV